MPSAKSLFSAFTLSASAASAATASLSLPISAHTSGEISANYVAFTHSSPPMLVGNDKSASEGGFRTFSVASGSLAQTAHVVNGRTKIVESFRAPSSFSSSSSASNSSAPTFLATVTSPDSQMLIFNSTTPLRTTGATNVLGDWSALCSWRSTADNQYLFLLGKKQGTQFLVRAPLTGSAEVELVKVRDFTLPFEASGCATGGDAMYVASDASPDVYAFALNETTTAPFSVQKAFTAQQEVEGLAMYRADNASDVLFVGQKDSVALYSTRAYQVLATAAITGLDKLSLKGIALSQTASAAYPSGALGFAYKSKSDETPHGFAVADLTPIVSSLPFLPAAADLPPSPAVNNPISAACSQRGYAVNGTCACFAGSTGSSCAEFTCSECSSHGTCVGPDTCACSIGWGGLGCSFAMVPANYETETTGSADGDDPAVWVSPESSEKSRIITTFKSEIGAGLGVFDLQGKLIQKFEAAEPNNVDVVYGVKAGNRTVDLAVAGCRGDNTLCMYEITANGTLADIPGSSQTLPDDFEPYGSCTYRSAITGKHYVFVNSKTSQYLQYEITSSCSGKLKTKLVRNFFAGTGGQVEGCVADEENGWVFIGEEPYALWRYGAEPSDGTSALGAVATMDDNPELNGDVEGVTMVFGADNSTGYVVVSTQGVSAYNVYERMPPHSFVGAFSIAATADGSIDGVTNTDGLAMTGAKLGDEYPYGIMVTHDDANQKPDGTTDPDATFKIISLESIFGSEQFKDLDLLKGINPAYDPRA
ncbi:hypothetical protein TD95_002612 [Thielaviopsis punctulata]|uniref:BPP domain-containing protein n=1 Tax=Thielaviopsis punctulata TaxID=72032 RepID=A0A0F4ZL17_9PEZI|nr:hypothetical protein TD95_002612 [Thielaviopsis punctulata]